MIVLVVIVAAAVSLLGVLFWNKVRPAIEHAVQASMTGPSSSGPARPPH